MTLRDTQGRFVSPDDIVHLDIGVDLEVRAEEERTIEGRIIPYGQRIMFRGKPESFARGAASGIDPSTITLFYAHDHQKGELPIGVGVAIEEREDGAYARFKVAATEKGNEVLQLAKEKVLRFFSPGFVIGTQSQDGTITSLRSLPEVSLTPFPAYSGAQVLSVREEGKETMPENNTTEPEPQSEPQSEVDVDALQTRVSEMAQTIDRLESSANAPAANGNSRLVPNTLTPKNWFYAQVEANFRNKTQRIEQIEEDFDALKTRVSEGEIETRDIYEDIGLETRALADVTGGQTQAGDNDPADDLSGLVVEEFMADQIVHILNRRRPMFANLGQFRMPRSGYAKIPTVTQNTVVSHRTTQKAETSSQKMITTNADFKAEWLSGAVDIALEVIRTADVSVLDIVWSDLLGQYAKATELDSGAGIVPFIEDDAAGSLHGFTYTEAALDTSSYAAFIDDVLQWSETVEDESDAPAELLFVTRAQFRTIAGFVDANDRRLFSVLGSTNADARAGLNAKAIQLPDGPTVIKARSDDLTAAVLTNTDSLKVADGGPERLEALNVAQIGRDLGLLGRTMIVPRIPSGVVRFTTEPV